MDPATLLVLAEFGLRLGTVVWLLARGRHTPSVRIAWILVVLALPLLGVLLYAIFGRPRGISKVLARHRQVIRAVRRFAVREFGAVFAPEPAGDPVDLPQLLCRRHGNRLELLGMHPGRDTTDPMHQLLDDFDAASESIHLLAYIFLEDDAGRAVAGALTRAATRGVRCRVLVDSLGSAPFLESALCRSLRDAGVLVREALPVRVLRTFAIRLDLRNHRKIAVVDGRIGWTGSRNVAMPDFAVKAAFAPWVDVLLRIEGPAVFDLQLLFVEDWLLEQDEPIADVLTPPPAPIEDGLVVEVFGSGPHDNPAWLRELSMVGFLRAREELIVTTPYFVPDDATATALCAAARAGVRTTLVVPARNDSGLVAAASRSFYDDLLSAGVRIREYRPGLLHAKTITIDRDLAVVASANLDRRSFELNYELTVLVRDRAFTEELRALQLEYIADTNVIHPAEWRARSWLRKLHENTVALLTPLL